MLAVEMTTKVNKSLLSKLKVLCVCEIQSSVGIKKYKKDTTNKHKKTDKKVFLNFLWEITFLASWHIKKVNQN